MTPGLLTLVDVDTAGGSVDEAETTNTVSILTHFSRPTILLFVTARLAGGVNTDLSLQTVLVAVAHLGAQALQTPLPLGTVGIDAALGMTQSTLAPVASWTLVVGTPGWYADTSLLGCGHSGKPVRTPAVHILVEDAAESIGTTGPLLLTRVDTLEVDADLVTGTVVVASAAHTAHPGAADLAGRTLLAGDAGDHAHAVAALLAHQTIILATAGVPALASLTSAAISAVCVQATLLAVSDAGPGVQGAGDEACQTLAHSLSVPDAALSVGTAGVIADILAPTIDTETLVWAVTVSTGT